MNTCNPRGVTLESYYPVVGVRKHAGRIKPIRQRRLIVRCSCGDGLFGADYIEARRWWRAHTQ